MMKKKSMCYIEIGMLLLAYFSFSYILYSEVGGEFNVKGFVSDIIKEISKPMIPFASAYAYCEKTKSGAICQPVNDVSECDPSGKSSATTNPDFCAKGCCMSGFESSINAYDFYAEGSTNASCAGTWTDSPNCEVSGAEKGCCLLSGQNRYITHGLCLNLTRQAYGNNTNSDPWSKSLNEGQCVLLSEANLEGACVLTGNGCKFTTKSACVSLTGSANNFRVGLLCTAPSLNTTCKKTQETKCFEGKDGVYFVDSCGNRANIYDSSKVNDDNYWNGIVSLNNSCNDDSGNINSKSCGNCNRIVSVCSPKGSANPDYGDNYCADARCTYNGKSYKNSESWCVYDGKIGDGDDVVGSRHWKYVCSQGEVQVEPCADYRSEICVQGYLDNGNGNFSNAACRTNGWQSCLNLNNGGFNESLNIKCDALPDCETKTITIDKFSVSMCTPRYPEGFSLGQVQTTAEGICGQASKTCIVKRKSHMFDKGCDIVENEGCLHSGFTEQMNDLCRSLGDCGGEANINGKYTSNYKIAETDSVSGGYIDQLIGFALHPPANQAAYAGNLAALLNEGGQSGDNAEKIARTSLKENSGAMGIIYAVYKSIGVGVPVSANGKLTGQVVAPISGHPINYPGEAMPGLDLGSTPAGMVDPTEAINAFGFAPAPAEDVLGSFGLTANPAFDFESWAASGAGIADLGIPTTTYQAGTTALESLASPGVGAVGTGATSTTASFTGVASSGAETGASTAGTGIGIGTGTTPASGPISLSSVMNSPFMTGVMNSMMAIGVASMAASIIPALLGMQTSATGVAAGTAAGVAAAYLTSVLITAYVNAQMVAAGGAVVTVGMTSGEILMSPFLAGFGWGPLVVGAVVAVVVSMFLSGKTPLSAACPPIIVSYTCQPWQPPTGGDDCSKCNGDPLKPCSDYRCKSLGAACKFVNGGTVDELCTTDNPKDVTPPQIVNPSSPNSSYYNYTNMSDKGFTISGTGSQCVDAYKTINFGITTSELAVCKFDFTPTSFDNMTFYLRENPLLGNNYVYNHSISLYLPDPMHGKSLGINWTGNVEFYIKCRDTYGNEIPGFYTINTCVNQGEDKTAPGIRYVIPNNSSLISFGKTEQQIFVSTDEPSTCKWSTSDKDYLLMENSMSCTNNINLTLFICSANVSTPNQTNNYYIKCADQPWLSGVNDSARNADTQSYIYTLNKPSAPLSISAVSPSSSFAIYSSPTTGKIRVQTAGGGNYPLCSYQVAGYSLLTMQINNGNIHEQEIPWYPGYYEVNISCQDETGDSANANTKFEVTVDNSPPQISRVWQQSGSIYFVTSENADCQYSNDNNLMCSFASGTGSGGFSLSHQLAAKPGSTYYIKCRDSFGNTPDGCSGIVQAI